MVAFGPRSRAAVKLHQSETIQVDAGANGHRERALSAGTVCLTASWAGNAVADGGKGGLNFLFPATSENDFREILRWTLMEFGERQSRTPRR